MRYAMAAAIALMVGIVLGGLFPRAQVRDLRAQVAVLESLKDIDHLRDRVKDIVAERERLFGRLGELPFHRPIPSEANFVLCSVEKGDARSIHEALAGKGIFIRHFDNPLLEHYLRISVGRPEDTDALIEALREI